MKLPFLMSKEERLFQAAGEGNLDQVQALLAKGANINAKDKNTGLSALSYAAIQNHAKIVQVLVSNGADINDADNNGTTVLLKATIKGYGEIVEVLLGHGADANACNKDGLVALWSTAEEGNANLVQRLLAHGANVNARASNGTTALFMAAMRGHTDVVRLLLENGAEVDETEDQMGATALMVATMQGHAEIVKVLLAKGANINIISAGTTPGKTALSIAIEAGKSEIVQILKNAGAKDVSDYFALLVKDDHVARKEAIQGIALMSYEDLVESRSINILNNPSATDKGTLERDMQKYPDFDATYIRAGYPTMESEDHAHADVAILLNGVVRCKRRGYLLARLSSYYTWNKEWLKALDFATAAVLVGDPSTGPGDMVQVVEILKVVFRDSGLDEDFMHLQMIQASYSLSPKVQKTVEKAAAVLVAQYKEDVQWSAEMIRKKGVDVSRKVLRGKFG